MLNGLLSRSTTQSTTAGCYIVSLLCFATTAVYSVKLMQSGGMK
jgi:hypothetical protein